MYQQFFISRILKTMDADIVFDEIKATIKNDVLACFES